VTLTPLRPLLPIAGKPWNWTDGFGNVRLQITIWSQKLPKYVVYTVLGICVAISACAHSPSIQSSQSTPLLKPLPEVEITKQYSYGEYEAEYKTDPSYDQELAKAFLVLSAQKYCKELGMLPVITKTVNVDRRVYFSYFKLPFQCLKNLVLLDGAAGLESVSKELVTPYTHDFRGGVLINNPKAPFKKADVIIKMGSTRIDDYEIFRDYLAEMKKASQVQVTVLRNGKKMSLSGKLEDNTNLLRVGASDLFQLVCGLLSAKGENLAYCAEDKQNPATEIEEKNTGTAAVPK
jgi:hypothetical protein